MPVDGSGEAKVILGGYDFYSFPRISVEGKRLAWTCWRHPQMPWDGTELWAADLSPDGWLSNSRRIAGSATESIFQPEWAPDGSLFFISDRTGWWNLYAERAGTIEPILETDAEIGVPQWVFGYSRYVFLSGNRAACIVDKNGFENLTLIDIRTKKSRTVETPYSVFGGICSDGKDTLFFPGASGTRAAEVVSLSVETSKARTLKKSLEITIDPGYLSEPQ